MSGQAPAPASSCRCPRRAPPPAPSRCPPSRRDPRRGRWSGGARASPRAPSFPRSLRRPRSRGGSSPGSPSASRRRSAPLLRARQRTPSATSCSKPRPCSPSPPRTNHGARRRCGAASSARCSTPDAPRGGAEAPRRRDAWRPRIASRAPPPQPVGRCPTQPPTRSRAPSTAHHHAHGAPRRCLPRLRTVRPRRPQTPTTASPLWWSGMPEPSRSQGWQG
mmetsp:Transcript_23158/g.53451  ORF Transcript_23158/g.53451 Transcript_23158/m.53451 type:complete len:220 (-) Transcript_23158:64-723(-)